MSLSATKTRKVVVTALPPGSDTQLDPLAVDALRIDPRIERASTLPGRAYQDSDYWQRQLTSLWPRVWHAHVEPAPGLTPWPLLPGVLDEQLLLVRSEDTLRCLSNVCTHRGALLIDPEASAVAAPCAGPGAALAELPTSIRCPYHGRRFSLDGRCQHMPEFASVENFPAETDHLRGSPLERIGPLLLTCLDPGSPAVDLKAGVEWLRARLGSVYRRFESAHRQAELKLVSSRRYELAANWALYCDNYLEGFHIPFVHPALNRALDYRDYRTELFPQGSLQIGVADAKQGAAGCFELEPGDRDYAGPQAALRGEAAHGEATREPPLIAGYYAQLFPNLLLNFYPWGISINLVQPRSAETSYVQYLVYVWDPSRLGQGAGADLPQVELEDAAIVAQVQRGLKSRAYTRGRFSPTREQGVHHFQRWLLGQLQG